MPPRFFVARNGMLLGRHEYRLPGVTCPECGVAWIAVGRVFPGWGPTVAEVLGGAPQNVDADTWRELIRQLRLRGVPDFALAPGSQFGVFVEGDDAGDRGELHVAFWFEGALVTKDALLALEDCSALPDRTPLRARTWPGKPPMWELDVPYSGQVWLGAGLGTCSVCQRPKDPHKGAPSELLLPEGPPGRIFRPLDHPSVLIVDEVAREVLQRFGVHSFRALEMVEQPS
jgi:hypothetical protein